MSKSEFPKHVRPLTTADLERVIEIDTPYALRSRRGFFEARLKAAKADPKGFIYIGYERGGNLQGYLFARLADGEFGEAAPVAFLDALAVDPNGTHAGVARAMMGGLETALKRRGVAAIQSEVDWRNTSLVDFLAAAGFELAPRHIVERDLSTPVPSQPIASERPASYEIDYSDPQSDDFDALARDIVPCRSLKASDLPALVRIGGEIFGRDRATYYQRKMNEVLNESGVRVSMVAELDDHVVGFVMARVDFGEFGRLEPGAVIDTIEVDPAYQQRHVGMALISQLQANLTSLRVDVARSAVYWNQFALLAFLEANGFTPSQRLSFRRRVF